MERRRSQRKQIHYPVWLVCVNESGAMAADMENQFPGHASDIGETGILVESPSFVRGQDVKILANTGPRRVISVEGRVVYSIRTEQDQYKVGIMFIGPEREISIFTRELLAAYCRTQERGSQVTPSPKHSKF